MPIWQLCANLLIPNCLRSNLSYSPLAALELYVNGCNAQNCTVYVPTGTVDAYKSSEFGCFENIVEFDATGIDKVATSTNAKEVSRYSANGQRLSAPAKGLNIVKYSDGSVKKVVVQ